MANSLLTACGGFLLAVLWMDLMFDVQVLRHRGGDLPEAVLASIAGYYARVTTRARPMSHLVALVMLIALATLSRQVLKQHELIDVISLAVVAAPILLALARIVPNAVRLGRRIDPPSAQSALARVICRDHLLCFACVLAFIALQLLR